MSMRQALREKALSVSSSVSGVMGFLGGYQVCHNICLGIIALLSLIGITLVGMPLLFLTKVAVPFWVAAIVMLGVAILLVVGFKMNLSKKILLANSGLIIAGTPFTTLDSYKPLFWIVGILIVLTSIMWKIVEVRKHEKRI